MSILARHPKEDLLRYRDGLTQGDEKRVLEEHLAGCTECRDFLSFVKGFSEGLSHLEKEQLSSAEPCPDSWTLASYEAGKVDEETARHLRTHLLVCDRCAKEFHALRRASLEESRFERIERLKEFVIDMGKTYGLGNVIGPVQIIAERPLFAMRGHGSSKVTNKILEITVGENTYSLEVKLDENQRLSCDIAGIRTHTKEPLRISVHSGKGEELAFAHSDKTGNCRFAVPRASGTDNFRIITIELKEVRQSFLLSLPET